MRKIIFRDHKKKYPLANHSTIDFKNFDNFEHLEGNNPREIPSFQSNRHGSEKKHSRDWGRRQEKMTEFKTELTRQQQVAMSLENYFNGNFK